MSQRAGYRIATRFRLLLFFGVLTLLVTGLTVIRTPQMVGAQTGKTVTADGATLTISDVNCKGFTMSVKVVDGSKLGWVAKARLFPTPDGGGYKEFEFTEAVKTKTIDWGFSSSATPATSVVISFSSDAKLATPPDLSKPITVDKPDCPEGATSSTSSSSSSTSTSSTTAPPQVRELKFDTYAVSVNSNCKTATFSVTNSAGGTWSIDGEVTLDGVFKSFTWSSAEPKRTFPWAPSAEEAAMRFKDAAGNVHGLTFKKCQDPDTVTSDDGSSARPWLLGGAGTGVGALLIGAAVVGYRRRPKH